MTSKPIKLERLENGISIQWSDGKIRNYTVKELRQNCPCAMCVEKKHQAQEQQADPLSLPILSQAEAQPVHIESMRPVGHYAYKITFSDGHDLGIYTFEILLRIGTESSGNTSNGNSAGAGN